MFPLWTTFTQFQVSNVELCLHFKSCACIQNFHLLSDNNNAIKTLLNWASFLATSVAILLCQSQTSTQEKVSRKTHPDTIYMACYNKTVARQVHFTGRFARKIALCSRAPYLHEIKIFHVFYISWGYPS